MTPQNAILIKNTASAALLSAEGSTNVAQQFETIKEAYATVRSLQGATQETDYTETPLAAMQEYLETSVTLIDTVLSGMEKAASALTIIPSPLTDGIVLVPSDGSGSGSGDRSAPDSSTPS
jgi:hypothetical protein